MEQSVTETQSERSELREALAALAHERWSRWIEYLFDTCEGVGTVGEVTRPDALLIPEWAVERWERQMNTRYADLPEEEKASDQREADRILALIGKFQLEGLDATVIQAIGRAMSEGIALCGSPLQLATNLGEALTHWRNAEIVATAMRRRADEVHAQAILQASVPDFVTPDGAKLTNEAARKAWATLQSADEELDAGILKANAVAIGWWVENLVRGESFGSAGS